ncbi:hypothetical protein GCM10027287_48630 [Bordetella muralis]
MPTQFSSSEVRITVFADLAGGVQQYSGKARLYAARYVQVLNKVSLAAIVVLPSVGAGARMLPGVSLSLMGMPGPV